MNLSKTGLKQFELVAEAFSILLHAAYLTRFLLRVSFPDLMEVRADIRGEMHYAGWRDLNYGPCYWIDLARNWIPVNLAVCTHSAVPSSDSEEFLQACLFMTVLFAIVTCIHCFILLWVLVKNGHGPLLKYSAFYHQILAFIEARELKSLAMMFLFSVLFLFSLFGPFYLISLGISSIKRFFGESAILPGGTLLLLCLMVYNIGGLLGVWNIRSRYEQVATLVGLQSRAQATYKFPFPTEPMGESLFQLIIASASRLVAALFVLCGMGLSLRLDYPDASVAFSMGWWSDLRLMRLLQTAPRGLEVSSMDVTRLSYWYNVSEKFANPSHHPGLMDPISPLAYSFGSFGRYFSEVCVWCFFGILTICILGFIIVFREVVATEIRDYFWRLRSRQYIQANEGHSHGPLLPHEEVAELRTMYTLLSATRAIWTSVALMTVVLLLVPERWHLLVHVLYMLWLTSKAAKSGRYLVKRVKAYLSYMNAHV